MENLENLLRDIEKEWSYDHNFKRSWISSKHDLSWLQRQNILATTTELDHKWVAEEHMLQAYLVQAERDPRVAALVILGSVPEIQRLVNSRPVASKEVIRDGVVYELHLDDRQDVWMVEVFGKL